MCQEVLTLVEVFTPQNSLLLPLYVVAGSICLSMLCSLNEWMRILNLEKNIDMCLLSFIPAQKFSLKNFLKSRLLCFT